MKRRRRRRSCGFFDEFCVLSRKKIAREGNLMEEMAPAVTLPLGMANSVRESPMEIARLKLMADTAAGILMPDPNTAHLCEGEDRDDVEARRTPGSDDDDDDDSSSVASMALDSETGTPSSADSTTDAGNSSIELVGASALDLSPEAVEPEVRGRKRSVYLLDYFPLWGCVSICGRRSEMEDAVVAVPRFFDIPLWMVAGDQAIDGLDASSVRLPAHFFGVYDGHGGAQVANYCQERLHRALIEELQSAKQCARECGGDGRKKQWEKAFTDCFQKVDDEVGGVVRRRGVGEEEEEDSNGCCVPPAEPIAPETVGTTAVVAVICSSHVIIANCGDSRAVLCRGKLPVALSVDHKPNREDEYARIEAAGGKVIKWNGYRVLGVLAMSRSIGDRYLKPWIIPEPEVTIIPRTKDDESLILASDGLWDVMSNEEACDAARRRIALWHKKNGVVSTSTHKGEEADPAAQAAADYLWKLALQKGSKDNISVVVIDLKVQRRFRSKSRHDDTSMY